MAECRRMRPLLGTYVEIRCEIPAAQSRLQVMAAMDAAFGQMQDINDLMSFHSASSELSALNQQPGRWLTLNRHTLRVLRLARQMGEATNNLFNATVGGELVTHRALPWQGQDFMTSGVATDIEVSAGRARLLRPVLVTLDGIAKGYAVDIAAATLKQAGIHNGCINAGGDMRLFGPKPQAIQCRHLSNDTFLVSDIAIASSAFHNKDSERFPSHLVGDARLDSISIAARQAWRADALTKVAIQWPEASRQQQLRRLGGTVLGREVTAVAEEGSMLPDHQLPHRATVTSNRSLLA